MNGLQTSIKLSCGWWLYPKHCTRKERKWWR